MSTTTGTAALRNGTKVLTPTGWIRIESLVPGGSVIGSDGNATKVETVWPHADRPMVRVEFKDGAIIDCDGGHLWTVRPHGRKWNVPEDRQWINLTAGEMVGRTVTNGGTKRFEVPIVAPVQFGPQPDLLVDPYVLGALLGDGSVSQRSTVEMAVEAQIASLVAERVAHLGCEVVARPKSHKGLMAVYTITHPHRGVNPMLDRLREIGVMGMRAWEKSIPEVYKRASVADRLELVRGLMDTDGTCKKNGVPYFATTSLVLARDLCEVVESLGGLASIGVEYEPAYQYKGESLHGRTRYPMCPQLPAEMNPFHLERKAERVRRTRAFTRRIVSVTPIDRADATCITVAADDGLFVAEGHVVTHHRPSIRMYDDQAAVLAEVPELEPAP